MEEGKNGATWISQVVKEGQIVSAKNKVKFVDEIGYSLKWNKTRV